MNYVTIINLTCQVLFLFLIAAAVSVRMYCCCHLVVKLGVTQLSYNDHLVHMVDNQSH